MSKICAICRKSDMLCAACELLLQNNEVTSAEVDIERTLARMGVDAEFERTINYRNRVIIIAGRDAGKIIGKGGKNARELTKVLGREVDIIETGDEKKMVEKMLRVPALGINKVYGAEEKYRVRVESKFRPRVRADLSLMRLVLGKPVEVVFE